jgi:hypothetical protein
MSDFDPESCFVFTSSRHRLVPREPSEYVVWSDSIIKIHASESAEEPRRILGSARWCTVCLSSASEDEENLRDVVDAHGDDLINALGTIFDFKTGDFLSDPVSFLTWGDVIYFEGIRVKRGAPARFVAGELIDHVLRSHGGSAAGALFAFGAEDGDYLRDAFKDRGFNVVKREHEVEYYAFDLGARRPPLPPLPEDAKRVRPLGREPGGG